MSIDEDIRPVTYLKSRAADLLRQVNRTRRPVIITQNGEPRAVLQDPKSYEDMRNALGLLKLIAQGEEDILKGVVGGKSNKEIGSDLNIQEKTVKHYMTIILSKLQARNRVEAALIAQKAWADK